MIDHSTSRTSVYLQRLLSLLEKERKHFDSEIVKLTIEILAKEKQKIKRVSLR